MGEANLIRQYIAAGLSVIPIVKGEKNPSCDWAKFQKNIATEEEVQNWKYPIALIGGAISGGLVCIDFDDHGSRFADWFDSVRAEDPPLADLLVIQQTPSEGYHVIFRTQEEIRNGKLARLAERNSEGKIDLIETRGEGGYFLVSPSDGYILKQNDFFSIPDLSKEQVEILISNAKKFNLKAKEAIPDTTQANSEFGLSPFDSYDTKINPIPLLEEYGWKVVRTSGEAVSLCRPGKQRGVSATWNHIPGRLYVFTTNTEFENEHVYKPSAIYTILKHNGDFKKAAKDLFSRGYGEAKKFNVEVNAEKEIILPYFSAKDFQADILRYRSEGAPPSESTGWHSLDRYYRVARGQLNVITGIPSHGKALYIGTPIMTASGCYKDLAYIHPGEIILNEEAEGIRVIAETEIQYNRPCYKISFNDGSQIIADEQHEWRINIYGTRLRFIRKADFITKYICDLLKLGGNEYKLFIFSEDKAFEIISCEPCASVPVKCIQVSGKSKLYLAGKSLIPTHNSEILDNLTVNMAKKSNWKFLFFSPENFPLEFHYQKLAEKFLDKPFMAFTKEENEIAINFVNDHYKFIMTNDQSVNVSCLLATANKILETEKFDGFIIDPWNEIEPQRPAGMNETDFVSISLSMFRKFARKNNIATFIVAHPTKLKKEKNNDGKMAYAIPDLYSISGSAHFYNKADNGITVWRDFERKITKVIIQKVKFKFYGSIGEVELSYKHGSGIFEEVLSEEEKRLRELLKNENSYSF